MNSKLRPRGNNGCFLIVVRVVSGILSSLGGIVGITGCTFGIVGGLIRVTLHIQIADARIESGTSIGIVGKTPGALGGILGAIGCLLCGVCGVLGVLCESGPDGPEA